MTPIETQKLTRSKVLKRAGIGAAAAWTVPMFGVDPILLTP
jgi:hypothetical protein